MKYIYAFLFAGICCAIGQILLDNFKLTPGHITCIFVILGSLLSFLGLYDNIISKCGAGATILISNFGHLLYTGALNGYLASGSIGIFTGMFTKCSCALTAVIIFSFIATLIFRPKD